MKSPDGMTACVISADRENLKCSFKGTECLCYVTSRFSEERFCALTQNAKCLSMFCLRRKVNRVSFLTDANGLMRRYVLAVKGKETPF